MAEPMFACGRCGLSIPAIFGLCHRCREAEEIEECLTLDDRPDEDSCEVLYTAGEVDRVLDEDFDE